MFPLGRSTHTFLRYRLRAIGKTFLCRKANHSVQAETRPDDFRRDIVSDGIKAVLLVKILRDFTPSRYLAKTASITGMTKRISAGKKVNIKLFLSVVKPYSVYLFRLISLYLSLI